MRVFGNSMKGGMLKLAAAALALVAPGAMAFSLLGPFTSWQTTALSYQVGGTIGGPMNLSEGFRWNVPAIFYAYDKSFLDYFGPEGVQAIDEAVQHFNDLPKASQISADLGEYSTQTTRENFEAQTLGLFDLKTTAMRLLMEEIGFTDPVRYTFALRARTTETIAGVMYTNYTTILRNFDPVTLQPSQYVNGTLYTYLIQEFMNPDRADALEQIEVDDDGFANLPVATGTALFTLGGLGVAGSGVYRVGLTRDDVGGIRFLYHRNNFAVETLLPTVSLGSSVGPRSGWVPFLGVTNVTGVTNVIVGTNGLGTNVLSVGLRGGRDRLRFQRVFYDSLLGNTFTTFTNVYTDVAVGTNATLVVQPVARGVLQPDIIFVAQDNGLAADNLTPVFVGRTGTGNWINNDAINGSDEVALSQGPGVIAPPIVISFSDQLPFFQNEGQLEFLEGFPSEASSFFSGVWGSFDGSTNPPVIYPRYQNITLQQLRQQILQGGN